ncbi:hypothetical protein C5167_009146 [Papaver somniferum]|uniref:Uncharacterized protein n=1 Tax=Papaver somniferum TaxID=3469 RepID=A0A4Y7JXZ8_PAPSO|nr:hypothetical protein C5167_009146 [Papaver somniferum]
MTKIPLYLHPCAVVRLSKRVIWSICKTFRDINPTSSLRGIEVIYQLKGKNKTNNCRVKYSNLPDYSDPLYKRCTIRIEVTLTSSHPQATTFLIHKFSLSLPSFLLLFIRSRLSVKLNRKHISLINLNSQP